MYVDHPLYILPNAPSMTKRPSQLTNQSKCSISKHNKNHVLIMRDTMLTKHYLFDFLLPEAYERLSRSCTLAHTVRCLKPPPWMKLQCYCDTHNSAGSAGIHASLNRELHSSSHHSTVSQVRNEFLFIFALNISQWSGKKFFRKIQRKLQ